MQSTSAKFKAQVAGNDVVLEHQVSLTLPIERTNLFPTPCGDHGIGRWLTTAGSGSTAPTITADSNAAHARVGSEGIKITWGAAAAGAAVAYLYVPTKVSALYTVTLWVHQDSTATGVVFVTDSGTQNDIVLDNPTDGQFTKVCFHLTADNANTAIEISPTAAATVGGETTIIGATVWEEGALINLDPFCGDTAGARWVGQPGNSTSILNVDPYPDVTTSVESFQVDRQLTTDMPAGTRLLAGYPAAQATVVLSGMVDPADASKDAAWLFDPWNADSPLYGLDPSGSPITVAEGVYTEPGKAAEMLQVFPGEIDEALVDLVGGTVTLTCIDTRNRLRGSGALPPVATNVDAGAGFQYVPGLMPTYAIDYLLRKNGVYSGPPPRPDCALYVSNHGSMWPEIAGPHVDVRQASTASDDPVPGKWFPQVMPAGYADSSYDSGWPNPTGYVIEWWQQFQLLDRYKYSPTSWGSHVTISAGAVYCHIDEDPTTHALSFVIGSGTGSVSVPLGISGGDATWRQVTLSLQKSGTSTAYSVWLDGVVVQSGLMAGYDNMALQDANVAWSSPLDTFQIAVDADPRPLAGFVPTAYFDPSLNTTVTVMPDTTGMDDWQVIQQVCDAEQAIGGFDELDVFRFRNRKSIQGGASARPVTSTESLKTLQARTSKSTVATRVQVPVNAVQVKPETVIWSASTVYSIGAHQTLTLTVSLNNPAVNAKLTSSVIGVLPNGGPAADGSGIRTGFRASVKPDGSGGAMNNLQMTGHQESISKVTLSIYNPYAITAYLVTPSGFGYPAASVGQPALQVNGFPVVAAGQAVDGSQSTSSATVADVQWPPADSGGAASSRYGEITLSLQGNPWMQSIVPASDLAVDLLADLYRARPLLEQVDVVPDPSLQLGDRITLSDPDGSKVMDDAMITGITLTGGKGTWGMRLNLRAVAPPRSWVMGVAGRSEMGRTTYV